MCSKHAYRMKTYGDPQMVRFPRSKDRSCLVPDCQEEFEAKGLCRRHYNIVKKTEIDIDEYIKKIVSSDGVCAICNQKCSHGKHLSLDHDHDTGEFRGMLCAPCNMALGGFRDDPDILASAIMYLSKWGKDVS